MDASGARSGLLHSIVHSIVSEDWNTFRHCRSILLHLLACDIFHANCPFNDEGSIYERIAFGITALCTVLCV